jgi:hypothetical protein
MASPRVDGAHPGRTDAAGSSSSTGSSPRLSAEARSRSQQLADQFAAQVQLSMLQSLTQLSSGGEPDDAGGDEDAGGGDAGIGIDAGMQQMLLMTSLFSGASKGGASAAQLQAQLSSLGLANLGATGAGAGSEAQLAQQLLGVLGGAGVSGAVGVAGIGGVDADAAANAKVVAQVAREQGVDPAVAVAMMLVESGGRSTAVGDNGTSFGLFQLHEGGMLTAAGLTKEQAFDPRTNATVALRSFAHEFSKGHATRTPGEIAAASQRPADPVGYAAKVDAAMARARTLLAGS